MMLCLSLKHFEILPQLHEHLEAVKTTQNLVHGIELFETLSFKRM